MLQALVAFILHASTGAVLDNASCRLSPDNHSVTIVVSNPVPHDVEWTMGCKYRLPDGGTASVSCTKMVPANAKDFELCTRTDWDKHDDSEIH